MEELILPLGWVRTAVLVICNVLAEVRSDIIQDDVDQIAVDHLGVDFTSIDIVQVFLDSTCLLAITDLVTSPV